MITSLDQLDPFAPLLAWPCGYVWAGLDSLEIRLG